jgi:hypothetical protein
MPQPLYQQYFKKLYIKSKQDHTYSVSSLREPDVQVPKQQNRLQ